MFSPSSGSLNSLDTLEASPALRRSIRGGAADSCFAGEVAAELRSTWTGGTSVATRAESGFADFPTAGTTADACSTFFSVFEAGLVAAASLPFSTVKMTCPTRNLSPSFTRTSPIVPVTDEGTSTTALSVSSSITGSPSAMLPPGLIIKRTRSPLSIFSPNSGSLNSVAIT